MKKNTVYIKLENMHHTISTNERYFNVPGRKMD